MTAVYFDSSALVKRYVEEDGTDQVRALLLQRPLIASTLVARVEIAAALVRAERGRRLRSGEAEQVFRVFQNDWNDLIRIPLQEELVDQAVQLARKHALRGYDAIHLASALCFRNLLESSEVLLATFDRELWQAASLEGLVPWPENLVGESATRD